MNRTVVLGIAIFFAVVGLALVGGQQTASGGDCGGCSGKSCSGKRDKCCGLFGHKCCGGDKGCSGGCSGGCGGKGAADTKGGAGGSDVPPPPPPGGTTSVNRAEFHAVSFR